MSEQLIIQFVMAVLVSIFTKTQDNLLNKFSSQIANKIQEKTGNLVTVVKSRFRKEEEIQFKEFASKPVENSDIIEKILVEKLKNDSEFRKSLIALFDDIQKIPDIEIYMKNISSEEGVKGAHIGKISNKTLKHSMENITAKKNVEGPTIEEIK